MDDSSQVHARFASSTPVSEKCKASIRRTGTYKPRVREPFLRLRHDNKTSAERGVGPMAFINLKRREIQIKIVYYGPGRGGKTTNLEYIVQKQKSGLKTEMVKIDTRANRTLFFDYLPIDMGRIEGFEVKIQLYTAPGQKRYDAFRRLVLNGVDGIVFVADSMSVCRKRNIDSFHNLKTNLARVKKSIRKTPLVIQCNKSDLGHEGVDVLAIGTIIDDLSLRKDTPCFEASALAGRNVIPTLKKIILLTMTSIENEIKEQLPEPPPRKIRERDASRVDRPVLQPRQLAAPALC